MTARAGDFGVCAIECKSRVFIMIEGKLLPPFGSMAALAVGLSFGQFTAQELSLMNIFVTYCALQRNILEFDDCRLHGFIFAVTLGARDLRMFALQRELSAHMIEARLVPRVCNMARFTAFLDHPGVRLPAVHIFVTAFAGQVWKIKADKFCCVAVGSFVTLETGNGEVTAGERVARFAVCFKTIEGGLESFHTVTTFAGSFVGAIRELTVMLIFMAVGALAMRERIGHRTATMALDTGHGDVLADEGIFRQVVIKFVTDDLTPTRDSMTVLAVLPELIFMLISMAGRTIGEIQFFVFDKLFRALFLLYQIRIGKRHGRLRQVALLTTNLHMFAR